MLEYNKYKNKSGIYCITNTIDDRLYIGSTNNFKLRFYEHKRNLCYNKHNNIHLQRFYNKYGEKSLKFIILEVCDIEDKIILEQKYIDKYNNLFNISKIAGVPPVTNRSLTKKDISFVSELYKEGKTASQISEELYGNRNHRAKINSLLKGNSYPEYKHLFKYRKYTQKGKKRNKFSKISKQDKVFIEDNMNKLSHRKIAEEIISCGRTTVHSYIKHLQNEL